MPENKEEVTPKGFGVQEYQQKVTQKGFDEL